METGVEDDDGGANERTSCRGVHHPCLHGRARRASAETSVERGPATTVEEPGYRGPLSISIFGPRNGSGVATGHWFTFDYPTNCGERSKELAGVRVIERPKTKARPFKSAVIYATANYGPLKREVGPNGVEYATVCTADFRWTSGKVKTKRPARKLIFYDGSVEPPRRIWPPVGVPPAR